MSQGKRENNSTWSENFAEKLLQQLVFPEFHRVDGNPIYVDEIKQRNKSKTLANMLTPDFVVKSEPIEANDPKDFYIDVNEITEGIWGNFDDDARMDRATAYAYLSAAADFSVSQVVDRTVGVHGQVYKSHFA